MSTSAIPSVIDALVTKSTANLPGVRIHDGYPIKDPGAGSDLYIGVEDPGSDEFAQSADSTQDFATMRTSPGTRDETGEIVCTASAWNGDNDMKAARDAVFAITAGVETFLRADPSLGLAPVVLWARFGSRHQLAQQQDEDGATAAVTFGIAFRARI